MRFNGASSTAGSAAIVKYVWRFGDGHKGTGKVVRHAFHKAGKYRVRLVITDANGKTSTVSTPYACAGTDDSAVGHGTALHPGADLEQAQSFGRDHGLRGGPHTERLSGTGDPPIGCSPRQVQSRGGLAQ